MKKILFFMSLVMSVMLTSCNDDCDHIIGGEIDNTPAYYIVGSWYEEAENEEIRFGENGTFYDRYANYLRCAETEGRYEYDEKNSKLTYRYLYMGQTRVVDWTIKNPAEYSFIISSPQVSDHTLEKIVESYDMKVGETVKIQYPELYVTSYASTNDRIASVSTEGTIKAEGEKGIAYIKMGTKLGNIWVKVTVGENCADMWHDYVGLIGLDYSGVRKALSRLGDPYSGEDGYSFGFMHADMHDVADITKVFLCPEDRTVTEIQLLIKESVPEAEILSYMKSRYYEMGETDAHVFYSSVEDPEASKAIIAYAKSQKCVLFEEAQHFLHYPHVQDLWTDFTPLFGSDKNAVEKAMEGYGYSFLTSMNDYSKDGSDYYYIPGNTYAQMVGFVFNPDKQVSEFWVYMDRNSSDSDVYTYLCKKYTENEAESEQYALIFYNDDKSMKVTFDRVNAAVIYNKVTMKQHEANNEILGNYHEYLGNSREEIITQYGEPFKDDGKSMAYIAGTEYVKFVFFYMNEETNKCYYVGLAINEDADPSKIVEFFNSKYVIFPNGTAEDGSMYAWTDGPSVNESTMGITYNPVTNVVGYVPLGTAANVRVFSAGHDTSKDVTAKTSVFLRDIQKRKGDVTASKSLSIEKAMKQFKR